MWSKIKEIVIFLSQKYNQISTGNKTMTQNNASMNRPMKMVSVYSKWKKEFFLMGLDKLSERRFLVW